MSASSNNDNIRPWKKMRKIMNRVSTVTANSYNRFMQYRGIMDQDEQAPSTSASHCGTNPNVQIPDQAVL